MSFHMDIDARDRNIKKCHPTMVESQVAGHHVHRRNAYLTPQVPLNVITLVEAAKLPDW